MTSAAEERAPYPGHFVGIAAVLSVSFQSSFFPFKRNDTGLSYGKQLHAPKGSRLCRQFSSSSELTLQISVTFPHLNFFTAPLSSRRQCEGSYISRSTTAICNPAREAVYSRSSGVCICPKYSAPRAESTYDFICPSAVQTVLV